MTREQENALHCLKVMIDEEVCEECDLYGTTGTDHCEKDCVRVAIQAIKDLDKMNGIALDLASENDELIEKLDSIRAEIQSEADKFTGRRDMDDYECGLYYGHSCDVEIIDKYRGESKDEDSN